MKKEAALQKLNAITFTRSTKSDDVEVPSTGKRKYKKRNVAHLSDRSEKQHAIVSSDDRARVLDSQEIPNKPVPQTVDDESTQSQAEDDPAPEADLAPSMSSARPIPDSRPISQTKGVEAIFATPIDMPTGEAIPETSPTGKDDSRTAETSALGPDEPKTKSTPLFRSSPPTLSKNPEERVASDTTTPTSSLSNLESTPILSEPSIPDLEDSPAVTADTSSNSSPVAAKGKHQNGRPLVSKLKTGSTESLRQSARLAWRQSSSADELSMSRAVTPTSTHSMRLSRMSTVSKSSRVFALAQQYNQRSPRLFEGMAFAISLQSKKAGESNESFQARMESAATIERKIKQAGGRVLASGFDELFEIPTAKPAPNTPGPATQLDPEIGLTAAARNTGFTALIADGHSRKVKYMQALALGIPCIAVRWITSCIENGELVDWAPYLLCAGESKYLDNAIRSRNLTPYDASTARLVDVINQRAKLLQGNKMLLVMSKKKGLTAQPSSKKMAYVFLARVLGASLRRVYSIEEAKVVLKAAEEAGEPFDWVYMNGKEVKAESLYPNIAASGAGDASTSYSARKGPGRPTKRKRASTAAGVSRDESVGSELASPPAKRVRTLSDELVIQSLILGRMIEDGEMLEQ